MYLLFILFQKLFNEIYIKKSKIKKEKLKFFYF
jgi:hypothetical protein